MAKMLALPSGYTITWVCVCAGLRQWHIGLARERSNSRLWIPLFDPDTLVLRVVQDWEKTMTWMLYPNVCSCSCAYRGKWHLKNKGGADDKELWIPILPLQLMDGKGVTLRVVQITGSGKRDN